MKQVLRNKRVDKNNNIFACIQPLREMIRSVDNSLDYRKITLNLH